MQGSIVFWGDTELQLEDLDGGRVLLLFGYVTLGRGFTALVIFASLFAKWRI